MNLLEQYQQNYNHAVLFSRNDKKGLTTIKYIHRGVDFTDPMIRRARALTLDDDGNIVLCGFEKFFNHNELETQGRYDRAFKEEFAYLTLDNPEGRVTFYEKLDGTLIVAGLYQGELVAGTSASTKTEYSRRAQEVLGANENIMRYLRENPTRNLLFEYISPFNQIGVPYDKEDYVLIGVSDTRTCTVLPIEEALAVAVQLGVTVPRVYDLTLAEVQRNQRELTNFEGYVAYNKFGRPIKFKTDDWFAFAKTFNLFHGYKYTAAKIHAVATAYYEDQIDDLIAYQNNNQGYVGLDLIDPIVRWLDNIEAQAQELLEQSYFSVPDGDREMVRKNLGLVADQYPKYITGAVFARIRAFESGRLPEDTRELLFNVGHVDDLVRTMKHVFRGRIPFRDGYGPQGKLDEEQADVLALEDAQAADDGYRIGLDEYLEQVEKES